MKEKEKSACQSDGFVRTIVLQESRFDDYLNEKVDGCYPDLPSTARFDDTGEMQLAMVFHDGYAFDTNPYKVGMRDRIALYYPTLAEVEGDPSLRERMNECTSGSWSFADESSNIFSTAMALGKASAITCPKERYDKALHAVIERIQNSSLRAFTKEHLATFDIALACDCDPAVIDNEFRKSVFFDALFAEAKAEVKNLPKQWFIDAYSEAMDLVEGKVREQGHALHLLSTPLYLHVRVIK